MVYLKEIEVETEGHRGVLYLTDDAGTARGLREAGEAVLIYLHPGNRDQDFSGFLFAVEDPEELEPEYIERAYRRLKGLPWNILRTARCLIRETIPEDVESFYQIYSHPAITEYMEGLYPEVEEERQYVRDYIEKVYTFFGFGVWTVIERETGAVIGRAGFSYRAGAGLHHRRALAAQGVRGGSLQGHPGLWLERPGVPAGTGPGGAGEHPFRQAVRKAGVSEGRECKCRGKRILPIYR